MEAEVYMVLTEMVTMVVLVAEEKVVTRLDIGAQEIHHP